MRVILVALMGRTPQIITETLYGLLQGNGPPQIPSEVHVITTRLGEQDVLDKLLHPTRGEFYSLCKEYEIDPASIRFDRNTIHVICDERENPLDDIRTEADNRLLANQITSFIRELTSSPDTILYCSAAGGRKTMSVYLACALQLFGRPQDTLFHVLVTSGFETHPRFYYKPKRNRRLKTKDGLALDTRDAHIELAEIPYIRLRDKAEVLFGNEDLDYETMVSQTQDELNRLPTLPQLLLDVTRHRIRIGDHWIALPAKQFILYAHYARAKLKGCKRESCPGCHRCFKHLSQTTSQSSVQKMLADYKRIHGSQSEHYRKLSDKWGKEIDYYHEWERLRQARSQINQQIKDALKDSAITEYYCIYSQRGYNTTRYGLKLDHSKIRFL